MSTFTPLDPEALVQLQSQIQFQRHILDALPLAVSVFAIIDETTFVLVFNNRLATKAMAGRDDAIGKQLRDLIGPDEAAHAESYFRQCLAADTIIDSVDSYELPTGTLWTDTKYIPLHSTAGKASHIQVVWQDITERKMRELAEQERQLEFIEHQAAQLMELSTPLLAISEKVVVMPLVGAIDSRRVQQIMESLLEGIATTRATIVILDITGVPIVDTQVANALIRTSHAVQLLGARVVLTGIRPEVAQTIVGLGVDLNDIITLGTLRHGIDYALQYRHV